MYHSHLLVDRLLNKVIEKLCEMEHAKTIQAVFPDFKKVLTDLFNESYENLLTQSTLNICEEDKADAPSQPTGIVPWIGGKCKHLQWLLQMIPYSDSYIEPFGGSAAVLLARNPSSLEIYNELNSDLINFLQVLQDKEKRSVLFDRLRYTPYSRAEYIRANTILLVRDKYTDVDLAWAFYTNSCQSFGGTGQKNKGSWGYTVNGENNTSAARWHSRIAHLPYFLSRLSKVHIEQDDAIKCIRRYDTTNAVFYCDPPYVMNTRANCTLCYANEMTDQQHVELLRCLLECQGAVGLSGYHSEIYDDMLASWHVDEHKTTSSVCGRIKGGRMQGKGNVTKYAARTECVWRNARAMELCNDRLF